ncbi:MAG: site-specific integrase [Clostridia bacterium]|nr:site-specific integrase [Clostridia bacterium]
MPTTGYLRERNGRYYAILNLYDSTGKRIQKSHPTGLVVKNNKRKAEQILKQLCVEYDNKNLMFYSNIKVADYFEKWLLSIKEEVRPNTFRSYKGNMENHIIPYFRKLGVAIQDLKPQQLTDYYKSKVGQISVTTIKHHHQNISKALSDAVCKGLISVNPATAARTPKQQEKFKAKFLNRVQINQMLEVFKESTIFLPVYLCSIYGLRRSEVLGLKWANIDLVNGTIWIKETLQQSTKEMTGGSNYTSDTKTESSNRTLPIIPSVREELLKQRAFQNRNRNLLDSVYYLSDYVCTFADGKEITPNYLTKKFHQIISKHKELPQIRFHDLRHSVASNLLNDGFSTVQVAEWLGHSSSTTTLKFYAHIDKTSKMAIAEKLAAS